MLCYFEVYRKVIQFYRHFSRFFSHIVYYKILSIVPCAKELLLFKLCSTLLPPHEL